VEGVLDLLARMRDEAAAAAAAAAAAVASPAPTPNTPMPHVIISPGPGNPHRPTDAGVSVPLFAHPSAAHVPILGVCLGHQALAVAHGASVKATASGPVHGRLSRVRTTAAGAGLEAEEGLTHGPHPLFAGCGPGDDAAAEQEDQQQQQQQQQQQGRAAAPPPPLLPPFRAVRYHSLAVDPGSLPAGGPLRAVAWADAGGDEPVALKGVDGLEEVVAPNGEASKAAAAAPPQPSPPAPPIIMALAHARQPHYGVQFHPESIATAYGARVLANFRDLALAAQGLPPGPPLPPAVAVGPPGAALAPRPWPAAASAAARPPPPPPAWLFPPASRRQQQLPLRLVWERSPGLLPAAGGAAECLPLFEAVVGGGGGHSGRSGGSGGGGSPPPPDSASAADAFWLDSATAPERARFSFMGGGRRLAGSRGSLWHRVVYRVGAAAGGGEGGTLSLERPLAAEAEAATADSAAAAAPPQSLWSYLRAATGPGVLNADDAREAARELPFNFWGGPVGYLGYELGRETLPRPRSGGGGAGGGEGAACAAAASPPPLPPSPVPDAIMVFADRLLAVDHERGDVYALALHEDDGGGPAKQAARAWTRDALEAAAAAAAVATAAEAEAEAEPAADAAAAASSASSPPPPSFRLRHGRDQYVRNVSACLNALHQGESYELCLTTALEARWPNSSGSGGGSSRAAAAAGDGNFGASATNGGGAAPLPARPPPAPVDPWLFYRVLRAINPAPYSAWLRFPEPLGLGGGSGSNGLAGGLTVACSSPERFLRADRGGVLEARPIKGTARRVLDDPAKDAEAARLLATSEKERSENLMIVDLLRNDLSAVCSPGSVHVPGLIELESYATVHQLVSTVRGLLRQEEEEEGGGQAGGAGGGGGGGKGAAEGKGRGGCDSVDAVFAAFPGGSMTGAPKLRSCDILTGLEARPRGVYSGAIGYVSVAPGAPFDLNIVIRTACFYEEERAAAEAEAAATEAAGAPPLARSAPPRESVMSIGAGGAVVVQSDPVAEYDEMRLKASALVRAAAAAWLIQHGGGGGGGGRAGGGGGGGAPLRLPPSEEVDALARTLVVEGGQQN
jgi:para-aminobenzoate synthetase